MLGDTCVGRMMARCLSGSSYRSITGATALRATIILHCETGADLSIQQLDTIRTMWQETYKRLAQVARLAKQEVNLTMHYVNANTAHTDMLKANMEYQGLKLLAAQAQVSLDAICESAESDPIDLMVFGDRATTSNAKAKQGFQKVVAARAAAVAASAQYHQLVRDVAEMRQTCTVQLSEAWACARYIMDNLCTKCFWDLDAMRVSFETIARLRPSDMSQFAPMTTLMCVALCKDGSPAFERMAAKMPKLQDSTTRMVSFFRIAPWFDKILQAARAEDCEEPCCQIERFIRDHISVLTKEPVDTGKYPMCAWDGPGFSLDQHKHTLISLGFALAMLHARKPDHPGFEEARHAVLTSASKYSLFAVTRFERALVSSILMPVLPPVIPRNLPVPSAVPKSDVRCTTNRGTTSTLGTKKRGHPESQK